MRTGRVAFWWMVLPLFLVLACDDQRFAREAERETPPATVVPGPQPLRDEAEPSSVPPVPPEVEEAETEWPMANRDYTNSRATTDAAIDSSNVEELGVAWSMPLAGASKWGAAASNPLVLDGVVYFQDLRSDIYALDLENGERVWVHRLNEKAFGPNGPAVGWGKVFVQNADHHVLALDIETGDELWRTELVGPTGAHQPLVYDGFVYTAISAGGYEEGTGEVLNISLISEGTSGYVYGLDQDSGAVVWDFRTVEEGFWGNPDVNSGAGVWFSPAIDVATGRVFSSTGNPGPAPGTVEYPNASSRPGPNLYSNSMLAFDGRSGDLLWHNQVKPRDLFHHDFQNTPILATPSVEGEEVAVVIGSGKGGTVYAFRRDSGDTLWETDVGVHENDRLEQLPPDEPVEVYPGFWGGIEVPGAVADGTAYFQTNNLPTPYTADAWGAETSAETVSNHEGRTRYEDGTSELVALDVATGDIEWSTEFDAVGFGGATVVSDLVFTATYDGRIFALRRDDGTVVWEHQAPGGIIAWPAVAGDSIVWPVGLGREPALVVLRLGAEGEIELPAARPERGDD